MRAACKALLALMLCKDLIKLATTDEVIDHPWMLKGELAHPDDFIPHPSALRLPPDTSVLEKMSRMASLDVSSVQSISDKLRDITESPDDKEAAAKAVSDIEIVAEKHSAISNFLLPTKRSIFKCRRGQNKKNVPPPQLCFHD